MSPLRFFREGSIFLAAVVGTAIGYTATLQMEPTVNVVCAFLGMSIGGAFADFCLRGGK
jgi:hypothetical protein